MPRRSTWTFLLAWLVVMVAIWQTAALFPLLNLDLTRQYLLLAALASLTELTAVGLTSGRLSMGFAVVLATQLVYGPAPAVWVWALATLVGQGIANRGNPLRTTVFDAARYTLAAIAAVRASALLVPHLTNVTFSPMAVGQSIFFTAAYFLTGLILSALFSRPRGHVGSSPRLRAAWGWDLFTYLITWPFGLAMALMDKAFGLAGLSLLFVPLLAIGLVLRFLVPANVAQREMGVLNKMAGRLSSVRESAEAFRLVLATAGELVPLHSAVLFLWSETNNCFRVEAVRSPSADTVSGMKLFREDILPALLAKELKPVLIADTRKEPSLVKEAGPAQCWRSLALFPLLVEDGLAGIMVLGDKSPGAFLENHLESLALPVALAGRVAAGVCLERRLARDCASDAVTGLYNRHFFSLRAAEEGERSRRFGTEFAIILLALDSLTGVAEKFGQAAAQGLLVAVTELMVRTLRPVDLAGRYDSHELAVLMPETGSDQVVAAVEGLLDTLRSYEFPVGEHAVVQLGCRVAWAVFPLHARDVAGLFKRLEVRLSQAAQDGPSAGRR